MKKTILVFKNELVRVILRRSFLLTLFLVPLVSFVVFMVVSQLRQAEERNLAQNASAGTEDRVVEGYVDLSGLIKAIPDSEKDSLVGYASEALAQEAIGQGEISAYYMIPPDYLTSGQIQYVRPDFNPMSETTQSAAMEYSLTYNLVGQDQAMADRIQRPLSELREENKSSVPQRDPGDQLTFFLPYAVTFIFYIVIFGSASLMLNSVTDEKQSRMLEILMTSITPMQMLVGKIVALGIAGLLQTLVWSGAGFALLRMSQQQLDVSRAFDLEPSILFWGVVFFLLGYAVYASLMAGVGSLVPNLREASQATLVIIMPLVLPLMLISLLANKPNGGIAVGLSLFPFTAPVAMMARLAATPAVPLWQLLLAVLLLVITAYFVVRSVAGMFRAQNLLSGNAFNLKVFALAMLGRV